jgi:multidrug efflux pump subunit AcrB
VVRTRLVNREITEHVLRRRPLLSSWAQFTLRMFVLFALLLFIVGFHWFEREGLKDNYDGVVSFVDVLYFTMISATTTGYGDVVPVTDRARMFDALVVTPIRIFFILILAGTAFMAPFLKTDFIGAGSATSLQVTQTMPTGTSLNETSEAARRVEQVMSRQPDLGTYSTEIAAGGSMFEEVKNGSNKASLNVELKPGTEPLEATKRLRTELAKLTGVGRIEVSVGDSESGDVIVYVESPDMDRLAAATDKVETMMEGIPEAALSALHCRP